MVRAGASNRPKIPPELPAERHINLSRPGRIRRPLLTTGHDSVLRKRSESIGQIGWYRGNDISPVPMGAGLFCAFR
jgi:hypothetical protein